MHYLNSSTQEGGDQPGLSSKFLVYPVSSRLARAVISPDHVSKTSVQKQLGFVVNTQDSSTGRRQEGQEIEVILGYGQLKANLGCV